MKNPCIALLCTLGVAACGGEDRPAQSPASTTSTTSTTETTSSTPQPATTATMSPPATPSPSPPLGSTDMTPRSYSAPDTTGNIGPSNTTGATGLPGPTGATKTPTDQGGGADLDITAAIRRSVVSDKVLSFSAKNVEILTTGGKVTLRGTVKSEDEKSSIEARAKATPGVTDVDNQLDVKKR